MLPKVSIHLALCGEAPATVRRTLEALARVDYPDFEVLVVDSNTADPARWEPVAEYCARLGARFRFFHLGPWPGGIAGALNFAARECAADAALIGVLPSGCVVRRDWLRALASRFADPALALLQAPQHGGNAAPAGHARPALGGQSPRLASVLPDDSLTLLRREALQQVGGWAEWTVAPESELILRLWRRRWRAIRVPESYAYDGVQAGPAVHRQQSIRQARAATQLCRRYWRLLLDPCDRELSTPQRRHSLLLWLPCFGDALMLLLCLAELVGVVLAPQRLAVPTTLLALSLALLAGRLAQAARWRGNPVDRVRRFIAEQARSHSVGKAVWTGLLAPETLPIPNREATAGSTLPGDVAMVRQEALLLVLIVGALGGVALSSGVTAPQALLWCAALLVQALPCLAAIGTALTRGHKSASDRGRRTPRVVVSPDADRRPMADVMRRRAPRVAARTGRPSMSPSGGAHLAR